MTTIAELKKIINSCMTSAEGDNITDDMEVFGTLAVRFKDYDQVIFSNLYREEYEDAADEIARMEDC